MFELYMSRKRMFMSFKKVHYLLRLNDVVFLPSKGHSYSVVINRCGRMLRKLVHSACYFRGVKFDMSVKRSFVLNRQRRSYVFKGANNAIVEGQVCLYF